jgi:SWI/SNF-related matrix-associated actin-dependent regulator 1 of chromatin subfamily A
VIKLTAEQEEDAMLMANNQDLPNFSKAGTGKTHTTLQAFKNTGMQHMTVLAPRIALDWWAEQAQEFLGADVKVLTSGGTKLGGDIMITTYDIARNMRERLFEYSIGGALALDESHYVRNPDAGRTKAVFGNDADGFGGLVSKFDTVWPLSGTPMEGYANDMWTQVGTLHPEVWDKYGISTYEDFCKRYTFKKKKQYSKWMEPVWKISGNRYEDELNRIIYTELGAIRRMEAPGLPKLRMRNLHIPIKLTREVRKAMSGLTAAEIVAKLTAEGDDEVLAKIWKIIGLAKVPEIVPYVGDLSRDGPVLLGCWHRDVMTEYQVELEKLGKKVVQVHGSTSNSLLSPIRQAFNLGEVDVLIGQMRKMGVSWNLQEAAKNVVIAETYPSPAVVEQFYKRVYRYGQKQEVQVDIILSNTPIDEALDGVRLSKGMSNDKING